MLAPPRKRPRSPSPASDDLTSPLDIILKRRRQKGNRHNDSDDYVIHRPPSSPFDTSYGAESSTAPWTRFVEKRRIRQWERLNNPVRPERMAQQEERDDYSSPIRPQLTAQAANHLTAPMSSSPIRHEPPWSSPFKPIVRSSQTEPAQTEPALDLMMDEEEMRREWGDEYYDQNSLLRNLHMQRASSHGLADVISPDRNHFRTPILVRDVTHSRPSSSHTPYRTALPASSPFFQDATNTHSGLLETPFRDNHPSSSPLPSQSMTQYSYDTHDSSGNGDDMMDGEKGLADELKGRYEATNKLLADLAMDRQKRWGG